MEQSSPSTEKPIDRQNPQRIDLEYPPTVSAEAATPSSSNEQTAPIPDLTNEVKEQRATSEDAPPLPPKDASDSTQIDWIQLGEFTYYRASNRAAPPPREELPPDFLEPTAEDLKSAQASLAARARAYQEAPLLTENLRKRKDEEMRSKWPTTTIRIKFADRSMVEKSFPSTSAIKPVYAFVRSCLREEAKAYKFVLYEPPRRELKVSDPNVKDKSLFDLHLAPRSILHFRFLEDDVKLDSTTGPAPLYPEILARAVDLPLPPSEGGSTSSPSPSSRPATTSKGSKLFDSFDKDKKIARLLKFTKGNK